MSLKTKLNTIGQLFGGYSEITKNFSQSQINRIIAFPGEILVTTAASLIDQEDNEDDIDLTILGYIPETDYRVYDSNFNYLYTSACFQYFGATEKDKDLGIAAEHGEIFYISLKTILGQKIVMLWVVKKLSLTDEKIAQSSLQQLISQNENNKTKQISAELFIYNDKFLETGITLYILPGSLEAEPTVQQILDSPLASSIDFPSRKGKLFKGIADVWLLAVSTSIAPDSTISVDKVWRFTQAQGSGIERIFRRNSGLAFVGAAGLSRISLNNDSQGRYTPSSLIGQVTIEEAYVFKSIENFNIQLPEFTVTGTGTVPTIPTVSVTVASPQTIEGSIYQYALNWQSNLPTVSVNLAINSVVEGTGGVASSFTTRFWKLLPEIYLIESENAPDYVNNAFFTALNTVISTTPLIYVYPLQVTPDKYSDLVIGDIIDVPTNISSAIGLEPFAMRIFRGLNYTSAYFPDISQIISAFSFESLNWQVPVTGFAVALAQGTSPSNSDILLYYCRALAYDQVSETLIPSIIPTQTARVYLNFPGSFPDPQAPKAFSYALPT